MAHRPSDRVTTWRRGPVEATWVGALWLHTRDAGLLVDAPVGIEHALAAHGALDTLRVLVLSGDRLRSIAGLVGLCDAVAQVRGRGAVLHVVHGLDAPRAGLLADAWTRGWPDRTTVALDSVRHHDAIDTACGAEVELTGLTAAEPGPSGVMVPVPAAAVHVRWGGAHVVWVPTARPNAAHGRASVDADLAVIEVGRATWPRSEQPWRPGMSEALAAARHASTAWLVGDDGVLLGDDDVAN